MNPSSWDMADQCSVHSWLCWSHSRDVPVIGVPFHLTALPPEAVIPPDYALQSIPDDAAIAPANYTKPLRYHDLPDIRTYISDF